MPQENRKRGKKHKKQVEEPIRQPEPEPEAVAGPSWILPRQNQHSEVDAEAPFGYVDPDVKAYFRTVDSQIREWQETAPAVSEDPETDPNEDRRLFLLAALKETSEKERQLATDPDCSNMLERMAYSMDDFTRRVFMDRLAGSYEQLIRHRFASHVCQTMFSVAKDTVSRESRGILPAVPDSEDHGELRTATKLILDVCEELLPSLSSLIMDAFASHVIRALLTLLAPHIFSSESSSSAIRSKKSAAWKSHQGPMKSVFTVESQQTIQKPWTPKMPPEFSKMAGKFVRKLREDLSANELRSLAINNVASPVLQMLLEIEADQGMADKQGSIMDDVLVGLITLQKSSSSISPEPSDYIMGLLRDPTSSHLLETLVSRTSGPVFDIVWSTYFQGKLSRLGAHPVANFVVAKAVYRCDETQLQKSVDELRNGWQKIIQSSRIGVVRAIVDRAATLRCQEEEVMEAIYSAFELTNEEERLLLVPCVLRLIRPSEYMAQLNGHNNVQREQSNKPDKRQKHGAKDRVEDPLQPKTQGALLLQSMLRISSPYHESILQSIGSMSKKDLLELAQHPTSSRVLDAVFDSPTVNIKAKHKVIMSFIGDFHTLVDNRIGSRIGDRCLLVADPYLKEKIARPLLPYEHTLASSPYGRYFAKNLNLFMFKRDLAAWKRMQSSRSLGQTTERSNKESASSHLPPPKQPVPVPEKKSKRKRDERVKDDIDELFDSTLGKKKIRRALDRDGEDQPKTLAVDVEDGGLRDVLGAIRKIPKEDRRKNKH